MLTIVIQSFLGICKGLVPGPPQIPESTDAQVPYTKWCSIVGLLFRIHGFNQLDLYSELLYMEGRLYYDENLKGRDQVSLMLVAPEPALCVCSSHRDSPRKFSTSPSLKRAPASSLGCTARCLDHPACQPLRVTASPAQPQLEWMNGSAGKCCFHLLGQTQSHSLGWEDFSAIIMVTIDGDIYSVLTSSKRTSTEALPRAGPV